MFRTEVVAADVKVEATITSSLSSPIPSLLRRLFNEIILCPLYVRQRKQPFVQILSPLKGSQSTYFMTATNAPHCMAGRQAVTTTRENDPTAMVMHNLRLLRRQSQIVLVECFHANQTGYNGFTYVLYYIPNLQTMHYIVSSWEVRLKTKNPCNKNHS